MPVYFHQMITNLHMCRNQLHPLVTKMRNGYLSVQKCEQRGYDKLCQKIRIGAEEISAQPAAQPVATSAAPPKAKRARTEPDAETPARAVSMKPIAAGAAGAASTSPATAPVQPVSRRKESVDVGQVKIKSLAEIKAEKAEKAAAEASARAMAKARIMD
jgi:hypothetical protein